ncbi:MAG: RtcB family protein [Bacteroidales bacterium]|nr:RtcB family protein [Bacteroidales bacterium]
MSGRKHIHTAPYTIFGEEYIDPEALKQMDEAARLPISLKGSLMPDAHVGYGLPIGGVLATYNSVIPFGVGMDIGCRMCLSIYETPSDIIEKSRSLLEDLLLKETRFGRAEFDDIRGHEILERREFREIPFLRGLRDTARRQLGTSGHGNHFVDIGVLVCEDPSGEEELGLRRQKSKNEPANPCFAILSHSGSRNMGAEIARHYTRVAQEKRGMSGAGKNLAWFDMNEEEGQEYWRAMTLAGDYSAANHRLIHQRLSAAMGEKPLRLIENHHNFAWKDPEDERIIIHRKGATPAEKDSLAIIPGSMTAPAYIVAGLGNESSLRSAAHGAGRLLSRTQAKKMFKRSQLDDKLKHYGVSLLGGDTDESPMAYKDIDRVMIYQKDLVRTIGKFYPKIVRMA